MQEHCPALCQHSAEPHIFVYISANSQQNSKIFYSMNQAPRWDWLMKKPEVENLMMLFGASYCSPFFIFHQWDIRPLLSAQLTTNTLHSPYPDPPSSVPSPPYPLGTNLWPLTYMSSMSSRPSFITFIVSFASFRPSFVIFTFASPSSGPPL
jgi:hypothetical protein